MITHRLQHTLTLMVGIGEPYNKLNAMTHLTFKIFLIFGGLIAVFLSMLIFCRGQFALGLFLLTWNFIAVTNNIKAINRLI